MPNANAINYFSPARWVVSPTVGEGTHTTIGAAIADCSSGDTIFVMPGTYTENNTISKSINIVGYVGDQVANVNVVGTFSVSSGIVFNISNIQITTSALSTRCISMSGTAPSTINLFNCDLECSYATSTAISNNSSNSSSSININDSTGNLSSASNFYSQFGSGTITFNNFIGTNTANSTVANSSSAGRIRLNYSKFNNPISSITTCSIIAYYSSIDTTAINTTALTVSGSGINTFRYCIILSGTATAIIVTTFPLSLYFSNITSSNTNAIDGTGTLTYAALAFTSSKKINVTTQTGGTLQGSVNLAPSIGFLGEQIRSAVASGSAIALTTATPANVTSISLTAGIWSLSSLVQFAGAPTTSGLQQISINNVSATHGTVGDNSSQIAWATTNFATGSCPVEVSNYVYILTAVTTIYLVASGTFSAGTMTAFGRINAIRIG